MSEVEELQPGTKACPGPYDALSRARENEPIFTLLGRDEFAPRLVRKWAELRRKKVIGKPRLTDDERNAELVKCTEAEQISWHMDNYRRGFKAVEAEPSVPVPMEDKSYSGYVPSPETIAKVEENRFRIAAANTLHNAVSGMADMLDQLRHYGMPDVARSVEQMIDEAKIAAEAIVPTRNGVASIR